MNGLSETESAWLAGLYEGEGHAGLYGTGQPCLAITSTDRDVLDEVHRIVGVGYVGLVRKARLTRGDVRDTAKDVYRWRTQRAEDVLTVAEAIGPWLRQRRTEQLLPVLERCRAIIARTSARAA